MNGYWNAVQVWAADYRTYSGAMTWRTWVYAMWVCATHPIMYDDGGTEWE